MQHKRPRIASKGAQSNDSTRRSISGASTASQETTAQDQIFESSARYGPIRPASQHSTQTTNDENQSNTPAETHNLHDHPDLEHIHRYNNLQATVIDPQLGKNNEEAFNHDAHNKADQSEAHAAVGTLINAAQQVPSRQGSQAPGAVDQEKKGGKNASTNAANEKELRELIDRNKHRSLDSIARDVRNAERTQKSERAKQLFAMRWLREFCRHDKESVPRNRVYTYYAQRCGTERVDTLNPASFGKLVRVIFPGIQTRRLGVRGESKYHYVNLTLVDDPHASLPRPSSRHDSASAFADRGTPMDMELDMHASAAARPILDTSILPKNDYVFDHAAMPSADGTNAASQGRLFSETGTSGVRHDQNGPLMFTQSLKFPSKDQASLQNEPLNLPSIHSHVSARTDPELADSLNALYRSHCTSLVDSVRYVKEKQFTRLLGSFSGTMTVPVAKVFVQPSVATWIKACDLLMYQQIIRFVSQLALQVIPHQVFSMLRSVGNDITDLIRKNFRNYPDHVLQAKLEPATMFAGLLQRLLRVNETAHAAANMLMNDDSRNLMWQDWVRNIRPKKAVESALSTCGHEEAYKILTVDMRHLLGPLPATDWLEIGTEFEGASSSNLGRREWLVESLLNPENIIERWATFLRQVPGRFPEAATRTLLHCMDSLSSAVLRDITVNQGPSFGFWWITKTWVDEMMLWMAESGGFLEHYQPIPSSPVQSEGFDQWLEQERGDSGPSNDRPASATTTMDFQSIPNFAAPISGGPRHSSGPPTATFQYSTRPSKNSNALGLDFGDQHDDSGIGLSLMAENGPPTFGTPAPQGNFATVAR